ncbi:hypothetical protein HZA33_04095 [Candidatus Pacearchaeota archaeon]|nr:hypothetical protein [Candidatus Pacearchaeota archaeon]
MSLENKFNEEDRDFKVSSSILLAGSIFDGIGSRSAIYKKGISLEANPVINYSMEKIGIDESLFCFKLALPIAIILGGRYVTQRIGHKIAKKAMNYGFIFGGLIAGACGFVGLQY